MIDDLGMAPERSADAREAVRAFLERGVRAGDEVILGTASGDAWWSGRIPEGREDLLAVAARTRGKYEERFSTNQMTEYEAFRIANYEDSPALAQSAPGGAIRRRLGPCHRAAPESLPSGVGGVRERVRKRWEAQLLCLGPACEPMLRGRATQLDAARRSRTQATLAAIGRGIEALRPIHGRKSLLLVSQGFVNDPGDRRTRNVVALSREANTAVYFLDVRGLQAMRDSGAGTAAEASPGPGAVMDTFVADRATTAFEESVLSSTGSEGLASDTGGFSVRNTNDLGGGRRADRRRVAGLLPPRVQRDGGQAGPGLAQAAGHHEAARPRGARAQGLHAGEGRLHPAGAEERQAARPRPGRAARGRLAPRRHRAADARARLRARARRQADAGAGGRRVRHDARSAPAATSRAASR